MSKVDEALDTYEKLFEHTKKQLKEKQRDIISNDLEYEWFDILKPIIKQTLEEQANRIKELEEEIKGYTSMLIKFDEKMEEIREVVDKQSKEIYNYGVESVELYKNTSVKIMNILDK